MPSTAPSPAAAAAFGRVLTAMVTPFRADGGLDLDARPAGRHPPGRPRPRRPGRQRDDRRVAHDQRRREGAADPRRRRGGGRPGPGGRRHRHQRHPPHRRAVPQRREGRRARPAAGDAVLQQAAAGGPGPALPDRRRRGRPAGDALRHPRPHRHPDRVRLAGPAGRARPDPRGQGRQGRPLRGLPGDGRAPTSPTTPATTRSTSPGSPTAPSASSASSVTCTATTTPRWSPPSTAATWPRRWRSTAGCIPSVRAVMDRSSQGVDPGQGGAAAPGRHPGAHRPAAAAARLRRRGRPAARGPRGRPVSHPHPELGPPPALAEGGLRVVALGGLGEVGRNMTVFEYAGQAAGRRLRGAVPRGLPARRRPDPARTSTTSGTGWTPSRRSC